MTSQSEAFDTALALPALAGLRPVGAFSTAPFSSRDLDAAVERGRASLLRTQNPDGSWPETTRPPHGDSYAQRISTTAWALMALLETN